MRVIYSEATENIFAPNLHCMCHRLVLLCDTVISHPHGVMCHPSMGETLRKTCSPSNKCTSLNEVEGIGYDTIHFKYVYLCPVVMR